MDPLNIKHETIDDAWARVQAQSEKDAAKPPVEKEERPPLPEALVCEAAAAGHYDQRLLTELTKNTTQHTWAECTAAMMDALANGLVEHDGDTTVLTPKGQVVLDEGRRTLGLATSRAAARIAWSLTEQDKKLREGQDKAAAGVRSVNDALDRLLEGDDEGDA